MITPLFFCEFHILLSHVKFLFSALIQAMFTVFFFFSYLNCLLVRIKFFEAISGKDSIKLSLFHSQHSFGSVSFAHNSNHLQECFIQKEICSILSHDSVTFCNCISCQGLTSDHIPRWCSVYDSCWKHNTKMCQASSSDSNSYHYSKSLVAVWAEAC